MTRIVLVMDHLYSDQAGTENQVVKIIHGLAPRFEIELITLRESEWAQTKAKLPCAFRVFRIDNFTKFYTYRNLFRFIRYLRARRPDVVHTFFPVSNIVAVLCARLAGVRAIIASRRDYGEWMSVRYLRATRFANRFTAGIVANSHEVKRLTERVEKYPAQRIEVIYNGIAVDGFQNQFDTTALKGALGIPATNKVVGLIANYRPMKRQDTFIQAAQEILKTRRDISFLLLGKNAVPGDPKAKFQRMVEELGLSSHIHFAHAAGNVKEYLSMLDVGVNCSEGEGLSNAIMEYMAASIPCVVSSSGGNPDLITDGVHGYTFQVGDHAELARKIVKMLEDESERRALTARARTKLREEMSVEAMLEHFARYYTTLAHADRHPEPQSPKASETEAP